MNQAIEGSNNSSETTRWGKIKKFFHEIIGPARFSVLILVAGSGFFIFSSQGQDVLYGLKQGFTAQLFFMLSVALWALSIWYYARFMLWFGLGEPAGPEDEFISWYRINFARILGLAAFWTIAISCLRAAIQYNGDDGEALALYRLAIINVVAGIVFIVVTVLNIRKKRTEAEYNGNDSANPSQLLKNLREALFGGESINPFSDNNKTVSKISKLPIKSKVAFFSSAFIAAILWVISISYPELATQIGAASVFLVAGASWAALGTLFIYLAKYNRIINDFPVLIALFIWAIACGLFNDNHSVRLIEPDVAKIKPTLEMNKEEEKDYFTKWAVANQLKKGDPVFIVAAEGGGIRAAYMTGTLLSALQDKNSQFANHLFAISGVSGGSLGAAAFVALLKDQKHIEINDKCAYGLRGCAQQYLSSDFLSPTMATMLFPDLLQRFLPFPVDSFDRGKALEESWEREWKTITGLDTFSEPFENLWDKGREKQLPSLVLNGTWVEEGSIIITSNLMNFDSFRYSFKEAKNFFSIINESGDSDIRKTIRLSTAVNNSARFTYVSPAGLIKKPEGNEDWGHIVDGGYFENSGASAASEILSEIRKTTIFKELEFTPIVLMITNDPKLSIGSNDSEPRSFMNEVLAPFATLLNTRESRGAYTRAELRKDVCELKGVYAYFQLAEIDVRLPLGWSLSDAARKSIDLQLDRKYLGMLPAKVWDKAALVNWADNHTTESCSDITSVR
jgi:hypothetical protein